MTRPSTLGGRFALDTRTSLLEMFLLPNRNHFENLIRRQRPVYKDWLFTRCWQRDADIVGSGI